MPTINAQPPAELAGGVVNRGNSGPQYHTEQTTPASDNLDLIWPRGEYVADARMLILFIVELINAAQCDPNFDTNELQELAKKLEANRWAL